MQKKLARLITPFLFAATVSGCATQSGLNADTCEAWTESSSELLMAIRAHNKIVHEAKESCKDGRAGAIVTLAGRTEDGKIPPQSLKIGATFIEIVEGHLKSGDAETKAYYEDVMDKYRYFLKLNGATTPEAIKAAALKVEDRDSPLPAQDEPQKKSPTCRGGVLKSCTYH